jgi:hypothetical protein
VKRIPEEAEEAVDKYVEFHRYEPRRIGEFPASFRIPTHLNRAGRNLHVTYRSGKVDPATLRKPKRPVDYIHEHDAGVVCYTADGDGPRVEVPARFRDVPALTRLGQSLGFAFEDVDGKKVVAESREPYPDLYTTPDGKCLLIIQSRKQVLAMIWGGGLGVFGRGIDG